jgi:integrase/recombinase XerC
MTAAGEFRVRDRVKLFGWRAIKSGSTYRILDGEGRELHVGSLSTTEVFLAGQPPARRAIVDYRYKPVPDAWAQPIEDYLLTLAAGGWRQNTMKTRRSHLTTMARGLGCRPEAVTGEVLVGWFGRQTHWAPETRKGYRFSARGFFSWAYRTGRMPVWIGDELHRVRVPKAPPRPAPDDAWSTAIAMADARTTLMLRLAGEAGLRRAEVARVHTRDLVDVGTPQLLVHGKGGARRFVPLSASLAALIRLGAPGHTPGIPAQGWLFPNGKGGHLAVYTVGDLVGRALPGAWSMHSLRHRFGTRAYRGSHDIRAVQTLLGHSSVATTERYTAVDDDGIRAAAAFAW